MTAVLAMRGFIVSCNGRPVLRVASFGFEFSSFFDWRCGGLRFGSWTVISFPRVR